jgi:hypothetical protein
MNIRIKALLPFKDGNILPYEVKPQQVIEVTVRQWEQIKQSGGKFEMLGAVVPPPTVTTITEPNIVPDEIAKEIVDAIKPVKEKKAHINK